MRRNLKQIVIGTSIAAIFLIVVLAVILVKKFTPSKEKMELTEYYTVPQGQAMVFLDDTLYEKNARVIDNKVYFDLDTVTNILEIDFIGTQQKIFCSIQMQKQLSKHRQGKKVI